MVRRYYKRSYRSNKDKYSVENTTIITPSGASWTPVTGDDTTTQDSVQFTQVIVPEADVEGMRKVKHLTLSFSNNSQTAEQIPVLYALVFVPQGYIPNNIRVPVSGSATSMYNPNQFVMSSGVLDFSGGPLRIRTPLSRNLNSGDSIWVILAAVTPPTGTLILFGIYP